jgi:hypothetical protein
MSRLAFGGLRIVWSCNVAASEELRQGKDAKWFCRKEAKASNSAKAASSNAGDARD